MRSFAESAADASLQRRLQTVLRGLVLYAQARSRLLLLEAGEASGYLSRKVILLFGGLVFLLLGYLVFLAGAVVVLGQWTGVAWYHLALGLGPLHLLAGVGCLMGARRRPGIPLFEATLKEFDKDREWLTNSEDLRP